MNSTKLSMGASRLPRYVECPKPWLKTAERERLRHEGCGRYAELDGPEVQVLPRSTAYLMVKP